MNPIIRLDTEAARFRALQAIKQAPLCKWVLELKEPTRTTEQNAKLWAMLADVARQCELGGQSHAPETWKSVFMHSVGIEQRFAPTLDGQSFVPLGFRSSKLSKSDFAALIEAIYAYGEEQGVCWGNEAQRAA